MELKRVFDSSGIAERKLRSTKPESFSFGGDAGYLFDASRLYSEWHHRATGGA